MKKSLKIRYTKKRLRSNLFLGLLWLTLGILSIVFSSQKFMMYSYSGLGILYLCGYFFENYYQYISIENDILILHKLKSQKIKLQEIKQIKNIKGDIILESESHKLKINPDLIEEESLKELKSLLEENTKTSTPI